MKNKKGQREISLGKLLGLILIILTLVVVLFFVLRANVPGFLQFLPDFTPQEPIFTDEEIEEIQVARTAAAAWCDGNLVGMVGDFERVQWTQIRKRQFIYVDGSRTNFYFMGDEIRVWPQRDVVAELSRNLNVNGGYTTINPKWEYTVKTLTEPPQRERFPDLGGDPYIVGRMICANFPWWEYLD